MFPCRYQSVENGLKCVYLWKGCERRVLEVISKRRTKQIKEDYECKD